MYPHKPGYVNNLTMSFLARFDRLGQLSDLEDAILRLRRIGMLWTSLQMVILKSLFIFTTLVTPSSFVSSASGSSVVHRL